MKHIAEILDELYFELEFREVGVGGKRYFYAENQTAQSMLKLMDRKALLNTDFPKVKEFAESMGLKVKIQLVAKAKEL